MRGCKVQTTHTAERPFQIRALFETHSSLRFMDYRAMPRETSMYLMLFLSLSLFSQAIFHHNKGAPHEYILKLRRSLWGMKSVSPTTGLACSVEVSLQLSLTETPLLSPRVLCFSEYVQFCHHQCLSGEWITGLQSLATSPTFD